MATPIINRKLFDVNQSKLMKLVCEPESQGIY